MIGLKHLQPDAISEQPFLAWVMWSILLINLI